MRIIEVGPRDGLQNESTPVSTEAKVRFIHALQATGLSEIEVTSFVSPKWVPQLADAMNVLAALGDLTNLSALVPNAKGLERALETPLNRIAVFTAASDAFTQKNINMTVAESLALFPPMIESFRAARPNAWVRGYVSTAFECPYAGRIRPEETAKVCRELIQMGCDEVSIGDTIGVAVPREVKALISEISDIPKSQVAWHFHDTRGTAIANVGAALETGYQAFDSSAAGLGGCPYAPGAGGNLATEDLVYFLERSGIATGVDLAALSRASAEVAGLLGRYPSAKSQVATLASLPPG